jgi:catechol 2,3-dioxygenase-like lactoylglutathione lyase family enzyme
MSALHHLAFRSPDPAALAEFYGNWLGLVVVRRVEHAVWLALGAGVLMLERRAPGEPGLLAGSLELFAVEVTPTERLALRARLVAAFMLEAETAHTLYFRDPDGRRVGVSSFPLSAAFDPA